MRKRGQLVNNNKQLSITDARDMAKCEDIEDDFLLEDLDNLSDFDDFDEDDIQEFERECLDDKENVEDDDDGVKAGKRKSVSSGCKHGNAKTKKTSFYGTSLIHLPLEDVSSENEITLRFRTSRTRGLLFLAAGQTDYCIIQIEAGRVHVLMQVGSGEIQMSLKQRIKVNDLVWHQLSLRQLEGRVTLSVDQKFSVTRSLPGDQYIFDVTDGVYVGSTPSNFKHNYASEVEKSFRGCIENVMFNNIDVLQLALETNDATTNDITQNCSAEFVAAPNDPISFVSDTSYIQMPRWIILTRGSFACWLKTSVGDGLILYQGGNTEDFIAVELTNGRVRTIFNRGSGIVDFTSSTLVNDANWHYLIIDFTDTSLSISVDYEAEVQEIESDSEIFEMNGMMFVGGVVLKSRIHAIENGIDSITHASRGGSFQGCIRDIEVNHQQLTFADTHVTHGISMECVYMFPCSNKPCKDGETCTDIGTVSHECHCTTQSCNKELTTMVDPSLYVLPSTKAVTSPPAVDVNNEPISTKPLTLLEGGRATITTNNIHLNIDLSKYGLRLSQILFRQKKKPKCGGIYRYVLRKDDETDQFTLLDLSGSSKITYQHDGSEHFKDKIKLELEILGKNTLPEEFKDAEFTIDVNIIPVNDPPKLVIPSNSILKIIQQSSVVLTSDELNAMDPDTDPINLTYSVLDSRKIGFMSVDNTDAKEFTQADINSGRVLFVHTGPMFKSRVTLRVNDGHKYSRPVPLRIEAVPLELYVIEGSKLRVNPGDSVLITTDNLNVQTNAEHQELDITYEILAYPRYGEIQKTSNGKFWKSVNSFQQRHIDKQKLRYTLNDYTPEAGRKRDAFSVRATCLDQTIDDMRVLIDILITEIRIQNNTGLTLNKRRQGFISPANLSLDVVDALFPSPVRYLVLRPPLKGDLLKNRKRLTSGQNFTQNDVNNGIMEYRINDDVGQTINDSFLFQAFVTNAQSSHIKFELSFVSEAGPVHLTNAGITVQEGGYHDITSQKLYVSVEENEDFEFTLTTFLQHGSLHLINPTTSEIIYSNISSFFNSDLKDGAVRYQHDHSEGFTDSFGFLASTSFVDQAGIMHEVQQPGLFNISVNLVNDHKPKQVVLKPFQVVRNGRKLLTNRDLKFIDEDIDFDDGNIEYRRQGIRNGQFVWVDDVETPVFRFLQRDIDEEKLLFKHSGVAEARMLLIVRDEDQSRLTTSYLKVVASDPFLTVTCDSELPVKFGHTSTITTSYLNIETNLNVKTKNIVINIVKPAVFGQVLKVGSPVTSFTYEDLYLQKIEYECTLEENQQENLRDGFDFIVLSKELVTDGSLAISIFLEQHQILPKVLSNKPFFVEKGKAVILNKSNLKVYHEDSLPGDIVFMVHQLPKYGVLQLNSDKNKRKRRQVELSFTQHDVNQGRVEYIQTKDAGEGQDSFTYDVDNGQTMLYNLTFTIEIVPEMVPIVFENITVREDGSKALTEDFIRVDHPYYEADDYVIQLTTSPSHGILDNFRFAGVPISRFTKEDIQDEFVYYVHDGSDTLLDSFSFIANFTKIGKVSNTSTVFINVIPVNDHEPTVVVNKGLEVIIGSTTTLSGDVLRTVDEDSGPNQLVYTSTPANNGRLIMKGAMNQSILTFSQEDLNEGNIMFVHSGAYTGGFGFQVSDSTYSSKRQIFSITAKSLRISLASTDPLTVSAFSLQPITMDYLMVKANLNIENLGLPVKYIVVRNPEFGQIVLITTESETNGTTFLPIKHFIQDDVKQGKIAYLHTDFKNDANTDSFTFNVVVPFSQNLTNQLFNITIKPLDASESIMIQNRGLNVSEGEEAIIGVSNLNAEKFLKMPSFAEEDGSFEILYVITELPSHGAVMLNNVTLKLHGSFTNQNIQENKLTYLHDDSDAVEDHLTLMISLVDKQNTFVSNQTEFFNITIFPVNDETFEIVTKKLVMQVPQGTEYIINKGDLETIDPDTHPNQIFYQLLTKPSNGYLVFSDNKSIPVMSFTQEDINSHRLIFIHDGSIITGAFPFEVSDGAHKPKFKLFNIVIIPTTIDVYHGKEIELLQGQTEIVLTRSNFNATTNGNKLQISYNITMVPAFGHFVMHDEIVTEFLQDNVDMKLVKYIQTNLSVASDSFSYVVAIDETKSETYSLNVTVQPAFVLNEFSVNAGSVFQLSLDQINATLLERSTQTDPIFSVAEISSLCSVVNVSTLEELSEFTYKDLLEGWVAVAVDYIDLQENETLTAGYSLIVSSSEAQPVIQSGFLTIQPQIVQTTTETLQSTVTEIGSGDVIKVDFMADVSNPSSSDQDSGITLPPDSLTTSPMFNKKKSDEGPPDSSIIPIIIPIIIVIIFLIIIILLVVWLIRKRQKEAQSGRESPYPDMDGGPYPGASAVPGQAGILPPINICAVNYSAASQEFPYKGSGSLHRPVASPLVPQVTVTALGRPPSPSSIKKSSMISINTNGTGSLSYSMSHDSQHAMPTPKLKKSQYWV